MARNESAREDLLGEATAFVERVEIAPKQRWAGDSWATQSSIERASSELGSPTIRLSAQSINATPMPIVAGFRACGALSLFFGEDPVYQFNAAGELRRAYRHGVLLKAERGRLVSLRRERTATKSVLVQRELAVKEQEDTVHEMSRYLAGLAALLDDTNFEVAGQVPGEADVIGRLRAWLAKHQGGPIAVRPNVVPPRPSAVKR